MLAVYTPNGDTRREFEFAPTEIDVEVAELIETHSGLSFADWTQAVLEGRARALRVLLWFMLRQDLPALKFADTPKFRMGEVMVEFGHSELLDIKANLSKVDPDKRERVADFVEESLKRYEGQPLPKAE